MNQLAKSENGLPAIYPVEAALLGPSLLGTTGPETSLLENSLLAMLTSAPIVDASFKPKPGGDIGSAAQVSTPASSVV